MREDQRWLQSEENRNYNSRHSSRPRVSFSYQSWYCLHHFERSADDLNAILRSQGALGRRNDVFPFFWTNGCPLHLVQAQVPYFEIIEIHYLFYVT
eukprot:UN14163